MLGSRPRFAAPGDRLLAWDEVLELIARERNGWLATVGADGAPHTAPLWVAVSGGAPWFWTAPTSAKGRNLQRDPRCSLHVDDGDLVAILEGSARRTDGDQALRDAYAEKYGHVPAGPAFWRVEVARSQAWRGHAGDAQLDATTFAR